MRRWFFFLKLEFLSPFRRQLTADFWRLLRARTSPRGKGWNWRVRVGEAVAPAAASVQRGVGDNRCFHQLQFAWPEVRLYPGHNCYWQIVMPGWSVMAGARFATSTRDRRPMAIRAGRGPTASQLRLNRILFDGHVAADSKINHCRFTAMYMYRVHAPSYP